MSFARRSRWFQSLTPTVSWILAVTVGAHLAYLVVRAVNPGLHAQLMDWTELVPSQVFTRPWTLLSMALVHDPRDFLHILFNMLALFSLGPWVERTLGPRRFLTMYVLAALAGSILYVAWGWAAGETEIAAIGASGAVVGTLVAFALLFPTAELRIWFTAPIQAKNLIWLAIGIDLVMVFFGANIAVPVHFGGMLGAWFYLRRPWRPAYLRKQRLILQSRIRRLR